MTGRPIEDVMKEKVEGLMAHSGVVAVALSELENGTPCIKILIENGSAAVMDALPESIEGHPVLVEISGEIRAMDRDEE